MPWFWLLLAGGTWLFLRSQRGQSDEASPDAYAVPGQLRSPDELPDFRSVAQTTWANIGANMPAWIELTKAQRRQLEDVVRQAYLRGDPAFDLEAFQRVYVEHMRSKQ